MPNNVKLLAFHADWCQPCHKMEPTLDALENKGYDVQRIDVDQNPRLAEKYHVEQLPTFIVLRNGQESARRVGYVKMKVLIKLMRD